MSLLFKLYMRSGASTGMNWKLDIPWEIDQQLSDEMQNRCGIDVFATSAEVGRKRLYRVQFRIGPRRVVLSGLIGDAEQSTPVEDEGVLDMIASRIRNECAMMEVAV